MKFLLFLLGIIFFFIFFIFSGNKQIEKSFFGDIFFEANMYIVIVLVCIMGIVLTSKKNIQELEKKSSSTINLSYSKKDLYQFIIHFFGKYIYYIATILFYVSLFLVFQVFLGKTSIPEIFLLFNILVIFFYFVEHKFVVFQDFLRINTLVISLYYIFFHILYLFGYVTTFHVVDFMNIGILGVLFYFFFQSQTNRLYTAALQSYSISFIFIELCVFGKLLLGNTIEVMSFFSFILALLFLLFTDFLYKKFHIFKKISRSWGLIFSYIFISIGSYYVYDLGINSLFFLLGASCLVYILFVFHNRFQNYISLLFSSYALLSICILLTRSIFPTQYEMQALVVILYIFSSSILIFDWVYKNAYFHDTYFFHIFSLIVNLTGVISFFFFLDFSILKGAFLLLGESVYFFISYFSLRKNLRSGFTTSGDIKISP